MALILFAILTLAIFAANAGAAYDSDDNLRYLQKELATQLKIDRYKEMEMKKFRQILKDLNFEEPVGKRFLQQAPLCQLCRFLVKQLQERTLTIKRIGEILCNIYITLSTWTISSFCSDIINLNMPILEFILKNSKIFTPSLACSILLQSENCPSQDPALTWKMNVTTEDTKIIPRVTRSGSKPLKILHISDLHLTPDYEIGGISDCGYPVCCKQGLGNPARNKSGKWGDYNCDVPLWTFLQTLMHINETHKDLDLIYFTGDIIDHTVWKASQEDNSNLIYYAYRTFFESFPNIIVLPIIGNHESVPLNIYAPPYIEVEQAGFSTGWLYTLQSRIWRTWLAPKALENVARQGYYAHTVNNRFKIIAINNNLAYHWNWWLMYDTTYLKEQLEFLKAELEEAEQNQQYVHILAHVPPGNKETIEPFEKGYTDLVIRFSHIIRGQFFGHTHTDELKIFYDKDGKPVNMGYNGASLTPFVKYNPNYKILTVDPDTYEVVDADTYIFNLQDANKNPGDLKWYKLYSMKEAYGLSSLSPANFDQLAENMFKNDTLFNQYWRYYVRDGVPSIEDDCKDKCKRELICAITTTNSMSPSKQQCRKSN